MAKTKITAAFAKRLEELAECEQDKDYTKNLKKQAADIGIPYSVFRKYINDEAECSISYLLKIAKYYNVSTDYLLGISDVKTTNISIRAISKYTGLSENAIVQLYMYSPLFSENIYPLNDIIIHESFTDLLDKISEYKKCHLLISYFERIKPAIIRIANSDNSYDIKKYCIDIIINNMYSKIGCITLKESIDFFLTENPHSTSPRENLNNIDRLLDEIDKNLNLIKDTHGQKIINSINSIVNSVAIIDKDTFTAISEEFANDVYNTISTLSFTIYHDGIRLPTDNHPFLSYDQIKSVADYIYKELKSSIAEND